MSRSIWFSAIRKQATGAAMYTGMYSSFRTCPQMIPERIRPENSILFLKPDKGKNKRDDPILKMV
jgi:hypothetical protein